MPVLVIIMDEWVSGEIKFSLYGEPIEMKMTVPAKPVKPSRMLPIFQAMTNEFVDIGVQASLSKGEEVSCRAGCSACCRQPVPISEIEVYQLADLVESLPEPQQSRVKEKFAQACRHLHEIKWFERMDNFINLSIAERQKLAMEYFYENIACPFLEDDSCSIHPSRPLSCREYLVTSPAENCQNPTAQNINQVKVIFKPSDVMRRMVNSKNLKTVNFVTMIQTLEWAEKHPNELPEKTGEEWMAEFFGIFRKSVSEQEKPQEKKFRKPKKRWKKKK